MVTIRGTSQKWVPSKRTAGSIMFSGSQNFLWDRKGVFPAATSSRVVVLKMPPTAPRCPQTFPNPSTFGFWRFFEFWFSPKNAGQGTSVSSAFSVLRCSLTQSLMAQTSGPGARQVHLPTHVPYSFHGEWVPGDVRRSVWAEELEPIGGKPCAFPVPMRWEPDAPFVTGGRLSCVCVCCHCESR